ncbi:hypothetical protein F4560_003956 [Saccharothrix ecbatanensis]|uniref:GLTT repeat-containing protein n=1 Tax=Saccharothrix ecbatanensis TaxID=1105145 RepID=A0A7W9HLN1_9PSEU|nr:hypothetical protein [Saccharothrix ecbatanensis]MBB5804188.1 hypothetical protein [Saccharothrix ecbatanensis]
MSGIRTRRLLRAAALLAVGASPLLASAASAAEAPTDSLDSTIGHAPKVGGVVTKPATDLLSGKAVKLPPPVVNGSQGINVPKAAPAPNVPAVPGVPQAGLSQLGLPVVGDALTGQGRSLPAAPVVPQLPPPVSAQELPDLRPELEKLPVRVPVVG